MVNKRREPRLGVSLPVRCKILPKEDYFYTVSRDLSNHGAKIISDNFLSNNDMVKMSLNLINKRVDLKASVRWCNKQPVAQRYNAGLHFIEMGTKEEQDLANFLNSTV
jgi:c-di-GMP-binding flagellar brake protein YcgR